LLNNISKINVPSLNHSVKQNPRKNLLNQMNKRLTHQERKYTDGEAPRGVDICHMLRTTGAAKMSDISAKTRSDEKVHDGFRLAG
jgi:hypothetical protein